MELQLEDFKPGDTGQMELYLGWLNRYERKEGEEAPLGLILCDGKRQETIELVNLERSGIKESPHLLLFWLPPESRQLDCQHDIEGNGGAFHARIG